MIKNFKVDFIGIGASRCGTTWISKCLAEHPEICFSKKKETHFFHKNYRKGIQYYKKFFKHCDKNKIKGEFTPGYFAVPGTAKKIFDCFPETKLIVSLRNPIERAYSEYFYNLTREIEDKTIFEEALRGRFKNKYLKRGKYYTNLKRFLDLFPEENILILVYEDIKENPVKFIQKIYKFLNVDPTYIPETLKKYVNTSSVKRKIYFIPFLNKTIYRIRKKHNKALVIIRKVSHKIKLSKLICYIRLNYLN